MAPGAFESLDDPVDVLTVFEDGALRPLRFRWQGRVVRVRRVSGSWTRREGPALLRYYAVDGSPAGTYELCFDPRGPAWRLTRAWEAEAAPARRGGPRNGGRAAGG
jgi:hypothetical protein